MLIGINPLLNPDLLHALALMGHGDCVAIVDSNFPAASVASTSGYPQVLRADCSMPEALTAILSVFPIDGFGSDPVCSMQVVGDAHAIPEAIAEAAVLLDRQQVAISGLERFAFYEAAKQAFVILQTAEGRLYGNLILRKGVVTPAV